MAKNKKRRHSRTVEYKRQLEQDKLAGEKAKNRWNPAGQALLWSDLVFLAASSLLEVNGVISELAGALCTALAAVLLLIALWLLFGNRKGRGGLGGGAGL